MIPFFLDDNEVREVIQVKSPEVKLTFYDRDNTPFSQKHICLKATRVWTEKSSYGFLLFSKEGNFVTRTEVLPKQKLILTVDAADGKLKSLSIEEEEAIQIREDGDNWKMSVLKL
ncbi:MAG: hypothetical protein ACRCXZ_04860 [Patescibacteria group bacterium]